MIGAAELYLAEPGVRSMTARLCCMVSCIVFQRCFSLKSADGIPLGLVFSYTPFRLNRQFICDIGGKPRRGAAVRISAVAIHRRRITPLQEYFSPGVFLAAQGDFDVGQRS